MERDTSLFVFRSLSYINVSNTIVKLIILLILDNPFEKNGD